ncbi:type II toxin-antitoxin system RelE/ParE family toxin [Maritalea sp.]|uniref:type II toxin-antitoxin system RelE/ParE family toxin n=1 Tax=Maritalea sp. TaxID=2003361 RepID=UPI003EF93DC5
MRFTLTKAAQGDLIDIYVQGVRTFGTVQAERYQDRLDQAILLIADTPKVARLRFEIDPPVRIHPVQSHMIVYLVTDAGAVRILRVRHQRENWGNDPVGL